MKLMVFTFLLIHGLIHLQAASKVLDLDIIINVPGGNQRGLWIAACLLFLTAASLVTLNKDWWWITALAAAVLSQYLITQQWQDAKYGTLLNFVILMTIMVGAGSWNFHRKYLRDCDQELKASTRANTGILKEKDLEKLPEVVSRYVRYSGAVGKPKILNFTIELSGKIRSGSKSQWMPFTSQQYNFIRSPKRLFFMKATMKGLPVSGYHSYNNGIAFMDIRLLSLWPVQYQDGEEMNRSETVTFFNDICCFAPGALIDERITWVSATKQQANAIFTNGNISISATLKFNNLGQLTDFISPDRYAWKSPGKMISVPWSTPVSGYKVINSMRLAHNAQTFYQYPEGPFCYGQFTLKHIGYNLK